MRCRRRGATPAGLYQQQQRDQRKEDEAEDLEAIEIRQERRLLHRLLIETLARTVGIVGDTERMPSCWV